MDNLTFRNNLKLWKLFTLSLYSLKLSMDNVIVYMETVYNSSNSINSTRNLNKNRKKPNIKSQINSAGVTVVYKVYYTYSLVDL